MPFRGRENGGKPISQLPRDPVIQTAGPGGVSQAVEGPASICCCTSIAGRNLNMLDIRWRGKITRQTCSNIELCRTEVELAGKEYLG